jgi:hypothetical protein
MKRFSIVTAFCFFLFGGGYAFANAPAIPCPNFISGCNTIQKHGDWRDHLFFSEIIPRFLGWFMAFTTGTVVLMGVVSGVLFIFGGQNEELLLKAKKTAMYAIIGLLVAMFAYFIVEMVNRLPFPNAAGQ